MVKNGPELGCLPINYHPLETKGAVLLIPGVSSDIAPLSEFDIKLKEAGYRPIHASDISSLGVQEGYNVLVEEVKREDVRYGIGVGRGGLYAIRLAQDGLTDYTTVLNSPVNGMRRPRHGVTSIYSVGALDGSGFKGSIMELFTGEARSPFHHPKFTNIPVYSGEIFGEKVQAHVLWSLNMHRATTV